MRRIPTRAMPHPRIHNRTVTRRMNQPLRSIPQISIQMIRMHRPTIKIIFSIPIHRPATILTQLTITKVHPQTMPSPLMARFTVLNRQFRTSNSISTAQGERAGKINQRGVVPAKPCSIKRTPIHSVYLFADHAGFEPATFGFGDRRSAPELRTRRSSFNV